MVSGPHSHSGGDVADWDNTESRERDEDAAWRDLVARFDAPPSPQQPAPWPEREDVRPPSQTPPGPLAQESLRADGTGRTDRTRETGKAEDARGTDGNEGARGGSGVEEAQRGVGDENGIEEPRGRNEVRDRSEDTREARGAKGIRGFDDEGIRGALDPDGLQGAREPDVIQDARRRRRTSARSIRPRQAPAREPQADDEGHFIPPAPPPLPRLDPIAKGAWAALFGGPVYLVVATAAGWSLSGFAVFCAVAAFITGFAILVLRMNEPGPGGPDDGDDGAVV